VAWRATSKKRPAAGSNAQRSTIHPSFRTAEGGSWGHSPSKSC
jgi:hypothetical protein